MPGRQIPSGSVCVYWQGIFKLVERVASVNGDLSESLRSVVLVALLMLSAQGDGTNCPQNFLSDFLKSRTPTVALIGLHEAPQPFFPAARERNLGLSNLDRWELINYLVFNRCRDGTGIEALQVWRGREE